MAVSSLPIYLFWSGPVLSTEECMMCYRRYFQYREEYALRWREYRDYLHIAGNDFAYLVAAAGSLWLGRPGPSDEWDYTIPAEADAEPGDWWDYEQGIPDLQLPQDPLDTLARYYISGAVCAIMHQTLVASEVMDAYNLGTGGPGGRVGERR